MASQSYFRSRGLSDEAAKVEALLYRYPDITKQELSILIRTFAYLPLLDFGLLAADERLGAKLDAFYADHGDKLRPPVSWMKWVVAVAFAIGVIVLINSAAG